MASVKKQGRRYRRTVWKSTRHFKQDIDVWIGRCSQTDDFGVDYLFTGQFRLAEQPPYRRMEPQAGSNQFFNHCDKPVFSLHVQKFVAHDGTLRIRFQREKRFRKEDDGTKPSKRDGTDIAGGDIKKGVAIC